MTAFDAKADLLLTLQDARDAMLWKLDGLSEYDVRRPLTPTGTNLLGLVKHLTGAEAAYFGTTFGRPFDGPRLWFAGGVEPNADLWATAEESRERIVEGYRAAWRHSNATIAALDLDAVGTLPWGDGARLTLHRVLVHMIGETHRHVGHADIVRELADGAVGQRAGGGNVAEGDAAWWAAHRDRVEQAAKQAAKEAAAASAEQDEAEAAGR
ncbi:DinB family protein [Actinomadura gamaensis]|uniref:DinB family protein n=1 Tax=Actinomadura gamaensis TaxID=1763541 RepID=A0ABV9U5G9_9ACTN